MNNNKYAWVKLLREDLAEVNRIADIVHTTLPERPEVFEEKHALYPIGCRKYASGKNVLGYGFSHPWMLYSIPTLDAFLNCLPPNPDCLYMHDVVVLPEARGHGAAGDYVDYIKFLAKESGIFSLALVSVYGTDVLWKRFGFRLVSNPNIGGKMKSYGSSAQYMTLNIS